MSKSRKKTENSDNLGEYLHTFTYEDKEKNIVGWGGATASYEKKERSYAATTTRGETKLNSVVNPFPNLNNTASPFGYQCGRNYIEARDAIRFSLKAYWGYALARNVIEAMVDLANRPIFLKGGNKKTREFIEAWWKKINIWKLKEEWLREWFRSANDFVYRYDGEYSDEDMRSMQRIYGGLSDDATKKLPLRYEILNPERIVCQNNLTLGEPLYYREVDSYEVARLTKPQTEADKEFVKHLSPEDVKALKERSNGGYLRLDPEKLSVALYKAQSYEPMGVPMLFGALSDIEAKMEMKRIDLSVARKAEKAILHVKIGETPNQYNLGKNFNPNMVAAMQNLLDNDAVLRTIVTDWAVNMDWLIPDTNKLLGAAKYEQIDKDIGQALNSIIFDSGEKFANTSVKVTIFLERLKEAGNAFINQFLYPEVKRVCKAINAKNVPDIFFEELSLKDEIQYLKLGTTLAQLGLFTAEELWDWMEKGQIPTKESSEESQKAYQELREGGAYLPLIGGSTTLQKEQVAIQNRQVDLQQETLNQVGRPQGSKAPQSTKRVTPIGANLGFSQTNLFKYLALASELETKAAKIYKKENKLKKLNEDHNNLIKFKVEALMANEEESVWDSKLKDYIVADFEVNDETLVENSDLSNKFGVNSYMANILRMSIIEFKD